MSENRMGGPLERLLIITDRFLVPSATRKLGEAEAENAWRMAHIHEAVEDLKQRGRMRRELEEARHIMNLRSIAGQARELLPGMEQKLLPGRVQEEGPKGPPPDEPVAEPEPDWISKFASFAQQASNKDFQALWAKVLAGEVIQPGRFSLRLLQHIALMRKSDAVAFEKFARFV